MSRAPGHPPTQIALVRKVPPAQPETDPLPSPRQTRLFRKKQIPACGRQASLRQAGLPTSRARPVPRLRDGKEKARDCVRDGARYLCVEEYEWKHARFVPKNMGRSGRYKFYCHGKANRAGGAHRGMALYTFVAGSMRGGVPASSRKTWDEAAATDAVAKADAETTERAPLSFAAGRGGGRAKRDAFVAALLRMTTRAALAKRRHARMDAPEVAGVASEGVTGLSYG